MSAFAPPRPRGTRPALYARSRSAPSCPRIPSNTVPTTTRGTSYRSLDPFKSVRDPAVQDYITRKAQYKTFHPSPEDWADQLLYFFLPDRFSDGAEKHYKSNDGSWVSTGKTPLFEEADRNNATGKPRDRAKWMNGGKKFLGGTILGATSKLGYLKRMGITALWVGPVFKQVAALETYHGYAIQHFLDVDPRFGTREDLRRFVAEAHRHGIYVLLDIVLNHAGDVFAYDPRVAKDPEYTGKRYPVKGFYSGDRTHLLPFAPIDEEKYPDAFPDAAIWPSELQLHYAFWHKGMMVNLDGEPPEITEADFFELKNLNLGANDIDAFEPTLALLTLCESYKFWIAYADIDGYRIDTVRHMGDGPTKFFATTIHDYARSIGKSNFMMVGEISGDDAYGMVQRTGLDAALGIGPLQEALWKMPQGLANPADYFSHFAPPPQQAATPSPPTSSPDPRNNKTLAPAAWKAAQLVTTIDDHDQVWRGSVKGRFCGEKNGSLLLHCALGLQLCTVGVPCIYSGTEQCFDGTSERWIGHEFSFADRFIRESMWGGAFGAFGSRNRHFFTEDTAAYRTIQQLAGLRAAEPALRRGEQILRPIAEDGAAEPLFRVPAGEKAELDRAGGRKLESVIAWSRILGDEELLCAMNTHLTHALSALVAVQPSTRSLRRIFPASGEPDQEPAPIEAARYGQTTAVRLTVPPHSFVVFKRVL